MSRSNEDEPSALRSPKREAEAREHLANERTLLAWVRTGVGLISVGIVVERAGALLLGTTGGLSGSGIYKVFGLALAALGCLSLVMGTVQFFRYRRMISRGEFSSSTLAYVVVVAGSLAIAGAFIVYVLL